MTQLPSHVWCVCLSVLRLSVLAVLPGWHATDTRASCLEAVHLSVWYPISVFDSLSP